MIGAFDRLRDQANGRWGSIHSALGVSRSILSGKQQPCPKCGGKDRFRYTDHEDRGGFYCNQCGPGDGFDLLQIVNGTDAKATADAIRSVIGGARVDTKPARDMDRMRAERRTIWTSARPLAEISATRLWWMTRTGIVPATSELRAAPQLFHDLDCSRHPGMLARVVSPDGQRVVQVHRTFLTETGQKAPVSQSRLLMPKIEPGEMDGGAVRLAPATDKLGVAEGIETAISATILFGIPCWAVISAGNMEKWVPPPGVEVTIFADHDGHKEFTGQKAAYVLANRLTREKIRVADVIPATTKGEDWNDALLATRGHLFATNDHHHPQEEAA